jgi:hypothetical protein
MKSPIFTKTFPLRVILTVTTGRLLTERVSKTDNGIGALYEILGWMTHDTPFTLQLGRFAEECKPWLLKMEPLLGVCSQADSLEKLDAWLAADKSEGRTEGVKMWLAQMKMMFPELRDEYEVERIPHDAHEQKHPVQELISMRGTAKGIVMVSTDSIKS